jgi:hypothetical protein
MIFKLAQAAEKSWRRLDGHSQLPKLITGIKRCAVPARDHRRDTRRQ